MGTSWAETASACADEGDVEGGAGTSASTPSGAVVAAETSSGVRADEGDGVIAEAGDNDSDVEEGAMVGAVESIGVDAVL